MDGSLQDKGALSLIATCAFAGAVSSINPSEILQDKLDTYLGTTKEAVTDLQGNQAGYCGAAGFLGAAATLAVPGLAAVKLGKAFMLSTKIPTAVKAAAPVAATAYGTYDSVTEKVTATRDILGL